MFKSLRLRIQVWHASILSIVIAVFGSILYFQLRHSIIDEIDSDLLADARVLEGTLRSLTPGQLETSLADIQFELPRSFRRRPGPPPRAMDSDSSRDNRPPPPPRSYFVIYSASGTVLHDQGDGMVTDFRIPNVPISFRSRDQRREVLLRGPLGTLIIFGRDVARTQGRLNAALVRIAIGGFSVLAIGMIGGWWLAGKAIEPIERISQTTAGISSDNLASRIDTTSMDWELRSLSTTLNAMLSRLEAAFEQQSRFTADASHELRTPISVLLSHCELSLRRTRSIEEYQQTIATCRKSGERMQGLVESLLTLARVDSGGLELYRTETDLREIAIEVKATFESLSQQRNVRIDVVGPAAVCFVDTEKIRQVLVNLVHNAVVYNRPGGTVSIESAIEETSVVVRVRDTGIGIPSVSLAHLFDRFYRVDESRSRQAGDDGLGKGVRPGSGLGLAICKGLIGLHSGSLLVESHPGNGSTFTICLPRNVS